MTPATPFHLATNSLGFEASENEYGELSIEFEPVAGDFVGYADEVQVVLDGRELVITCYEHDSDEYGNWNEELQVERFRLLRRTPDALTAEIRGHLIAAGAAEPDPADEDTELPAAA